MDLRNIFSTPWKGQGQCDVNGQYYPYPNASAPYNQRGVCAAGSYWPYPDGGAKRDAENRPSPPDGQAYYTSNDGVTVPVASPARPLGAVQGPPLPSTPLDVPLPPERPEGLESTAAPAPSALQRYQAATTPASFGSAGQFHTLTPEVQGPPMPNQAAPGPAPWQPSSIGQNGGGDPSSAANVMRREAQGNVGGSLFAQLYQGINSDGGQGSSNSGGRQFQWVRPDSIVGKLMGMMGNSRRAQAVPNQGQGGYGSGVSSLGDQMESARDAQTNNIQGMTKGATGDNSSMADLTAANQAHHQAAMERFQAYQQQAMAYGQNQMAQAQAYARQAQLNATAKDPDAS